MTVDYEQTPAAASYSTDVFAIQCVGCGALAMIGDDITIAACGPRDEQGHRHLIAMQCECGSLSLLADDRDYPEEEERYEELA